MLLAILAFVSIACEDEESAWFPVSGKGEIQTQERVTFPFNSVKSCFRGDVILKKELNHGITLSAQINLLSLLETEVVDGTLYISFGQHVVKSDSAITVYISCPEITEMTLSGTGNMATDFGVPDICLEGSGNINCSGVTDYVSVKISGNGIVNIEEMMVKRADVNIPGNGNVSLHVSDGLNVTIRGIGTVYYQGDPEIKKDIKGFGQIIEKAKLN